MTARIALWCGGLAFVAAIVGPLFAHFRIVPPLAGFAILAIGLLDAAIALVCGALALLRDGTASRSAALGGIFAALLVVGPGLAVASSVNLWRIGDITTDTASPPQFTQALRLEENAGRDLSYPGADFAGRQSDDYGDLAPLPLAAEPGEAFARVLAAANGMESWEVTLADPGIRKIEGVETAWLLRFHDDFVIEVRPGDDGGSVVHMRSKSRDGNGVIGANAGHVRAFFEVLAEEG